jgi:flagellar FliJ protein
MTRSKRYAQVGNVMHVRKDERAEMLRSAEARAQTEETRLAELDRYRAEYRATLLERQKAGMNAAMATDYKAFLGKLDRAIAQQQQRVMAARHACEAERRSFREAGTRAAAMDSLVTQCRVEEQRAEDRREQHASDERALRIHRDRRERHR